MKILLDNNTGKHEIDMEVTKTLHDLHKEINKVYALSDSKYIYEFGEKVYSYKGNFNTIIAHCDLFIYRREPVFYHCEDMTIEITYQNI